MSFLDNPGLGIATFAETWDSSFQTGVWTLTSGNRTADQISGSGINTVMSVHSRNSGAWYFEIIFVAGGLFHDGVRHDMGAGIQHPVPNGASVENQGAAYRRGGALFSYNVLKAVVPQILPGDIVGVLFDIDNGQMIFTKNGSVQDAVAGLPDGTYYIGASCEAGSGMKVTLQANLANITYSVPPGYTVWGGN